MAKIGKTPGAPKGKKGQDITSKVNRIKADNKAASMPKSSKRSSSKSKGGKRLPISSGSKRKQTETNGSSVEYPEKMVRAANERLRKLEKVSKMAESSSMYVNMKRRMYEQPNKGGKFFQPGANKGSLRFIGKKKFEKLSEDEQKEYLRQLTHFMQSDMSTASGLKRIRKKLHEANKDNEEARRKSYESFMQRQEIKDNFPGLTFEQYTALFHAYQYYTDVKGEHFSYNDLTVTIHNLALDKIEPHKIEEAMSFLKDKNFEPLKKAGLFLET